MRTEKEIEKEIKKIEEYIQNGPKNFYQKDYYLVRLKTLKWVLDKEDEGF